MDEIIKAVVGDDFVTFNEKFKDKIKTAYNERVVPIKEKMNKTLFSEMAINDGTKTITCKNCGKKQIVNIPVMGSCPFCGALLLV